MHFRGSLYACLFFIMCDYIKIFLFMSFFHFCVKQCFMKVFIIFSWFEVWYIFPLKTWKQQDLGFACIQGEKMSIFKSRKNGKNPILFLFTYYFGERHDMIIQCITFKKILLKNVCNLRHSNAYNELIKRMFL